MNFTGPRRLYVYERTEHRRSIEGNKSQPSVETRILHRKIHVLLLTLCTERRSLPHLNQNETYVLLQEQLVFRQVFCKGVDFIFY